MSSQEPYRSSIPVIQHYSPSTSPLFSPLSSSLEPLVRPLPRTSSLPVSSLPQQIHNLTLPSNAFACSKKSSRHNSLSSTNTTEYSSDRKSSVGCSCLEKVHPHHSCDGCANPNQYVYWPPPPEYSSENKDHGHSEDGYRAEIVLSLNDVEEVERKMDEYEKMEAQVRMAFVRKVYSLLFSQLAVTTAMCVLFMIHDDTKNFVVRSNYLFFVSWFIAFVTLLLLVWKRKSHPLNLLLHIIFTLAISYGIATIVATYDAKIVVQTFLITIGVFAALVVFTLQSRINFSSWAPFLYAGLWIVIFSGIIGWLLPFDRAYHVAISVLSASIFCGYILYDTYMLFIKLSPEEYIIAAIDLYLDVINLFIALLVLLGGMDTK